MGTDLGALVAHPIRSARQRLTAIVVTVMSAALTAYIVRHYSGRVYKPIGVLVGVAVVIVLSRFPGKSLTAFLVIFPFETFILGFLFGIHIPHAVVRDLGYWKEAIAGALVLAALREHRRAPRKTDRLDVACYAYLGMVVLYYFLPHLFAQRGAFVPAGAIRQLAARSDGLFVVLFLSGRHARLGREWAENTAKWILATGAVVAALGIYEFLFTSSWNNIAVHHFHVLAYRQQVLNVSSPNANDVEFHSTAGSRAIIRIGSVLLNPLALGSWLVIPLAIGLERLARGIGRQFTVIAVALVGSALILTQTRSAILSGLVAMIIITRPAPGRDLQRRIRFALLAGLLVVLAVPLASGSGLSDRTTSAVQGTDTSSNSHVKSFTVGVKALEHTPLGRGLGTAPGIGDRFDITGRVTSENYYLQVGDELGFATMLLFVMLTVLALRRLVRAQRAGPGGTLVSAMRAALWGLAIGAFLLHVWADFEVALTAWGLAGAALGVGEVIPPSEEGGSQRVTSPAPALATR